MKQHLSCATLAFGLIFAATSVWAQTPPNATANTNAIAESTVQYSATLATSFTNYVSGYNKVKYSSTQPAKSYLKFDFTGQNVNTNYLLRLNLPYAANNGATRVQVWLLNQSYPSFTTNKPSLAWTNAQANYTNIGEGDYNRMLTNGSFTATLMNDFVGSGTSGSASVAIPAPWGQYLFNNQIVVALTATNDLVNVNANGARFATNAASITFQPLTPGNRPPTISAIASPQVIKSTQPSGALNFTVSDFEDAAASLTNFTVALGNANITLNSLVVTNNGGGNCTLSFTPVSNLAPGNTPNATLTLTVTDSAGNSASTAFTLTVPPFVSPPVVLSGTNVNYLPPTNRVGIGSVVIPFQIVSTNVAASSLVVTGSISAYSTNLASISFTSVPGIAPNTNNCNLTVNANGAGVGIVSVSVIDTNNLVTNTVNVAVMVLQDSSYAACDFMNYQPSSTYSGAARANLFDASANLWAPRSVNGSVNLITSLSTAPAGMPVGVPLIRGTSSGNQNQLRLIGAPYTPGNRKVIFASLWVQWADTSPYGTTAQYPGTSTGGFVQFAESASASGVAMGAVCTVTNFLNTTNNDGSFYLGLYNGTNGAATNNSLSLTIPNFNTSGVLPNAPVNVVIGYDVDTGVSSLWLNQANSTAPAATLQDVAVTNLANVNYLVLRQNANMGNILISSAAVKVVTKPQPVITGITRTGANQFQIAFTSAPGSGGSASVVASSTVNGTYTATAAVINESPANSGNFTATVTSNNSQQFFRILQTGGTPVVTFPF